MPLYEYRCQSCGHRFEAIVKFDVREEKQTCPECDSPLGVYQEKAHNFTYSLNRSFSRMRYGK